MTYAVMVSADDGPEQPGSVELDRDCLRYPGGHSVRFSDLLDVYLERRASSPPALVVISRQGEHLRISSLEGAGALHELAGEVVAARENRSLSADERG